MGSASTHLSRISHDSTTVSSQGKAFLAAGDALDLTILNGLPRFGTGGSLFTSYQVRGKTVIDYGIANTSMLCRVKNFTIGTHESEWSDHAPVAARIACPNVQRVQRDVLGKCKQRDPLYQLPTETELDRMLVEVIHSQKSRSKDPLALVYGLLPSGVLPKLSLLAVYTAGSWSPEHMAGGAGIYYGNNCSYNMSLRVPGPALSYNQSCTFAVWMAIKECPRDRPLIVYTTSEFVANALTRYASSNAKNKWSCANGDLLRLITMRIRE